MIYRLDNNYLSFSNIALFIITLILCISIIFLKKTDNTHLNEELYKYKKTIMGVFVIMIIMINFIIICSISEKIYFIDCYKNRKYSIVEGAVEDFEYIYDNNGRKKTGVKFKVNNVGFEINKGIINAGYSIRDNIINENGNKYRIYYIENNGNSYVDTILRIDVR